MCCLHCKVGKCEIKSMYIEGKVVILFTVFFLLPHLLCCGYLSFECVLCIVIVGKCDKMYIKSFSIEVKVVILFTLLLSSFQLYCAVITCDLNVFFAL